MPFTLSLNTNPLVNRFAEPDDLIDAFAFRLRLKNVQLTHEFINPAWPTATLGRYVAAFNRATARTGVAITSGMTGPYGRLNHFGHPDGEVRRYYINWFKTFATTLAELGATAMGTQFAIFTFKDFDDPRRRDELTTIALDCWGEIAEHASRAGLSYLFWEPMSVGREFGETIETASALQDRLDRAGFSIPMWAMVDIDHGDVTSPNPEDRDPYAWAAAFPRRSPIIHIKQSSMNKGGHWPFTAGYNAAGRIEPLKLLEAIRAGGGTDNELCLELSFREREPTDREVIPALAESVAFWAPYVDTGAASLKTPSPDHARAPD